jgi:hypothetical protein
LVIGAFSAATKASEAKYTVTHSFSMPTVTGGIYNGRWDWAATAVAKPGGLPDNHRGSTPFAVPGAPARPAVLPATSTGTWSSANADTTATTAGGPPPPAAPITGTVTVTGRAEEHSPLPNSGASAWAYSKSVLTVRGKIVNNGTIKWLPTFRATAYGNASVARVGDPMFIELIDPDLDSLGVEELLHINATVSENGDFGWDDPSDPGQIYFNGDNLDFDVFINDVYGIQGGSITYSVAGGTVTGSMATGRFSGLVLPAVGAAGNFSLDASSLNLDLDYDLPDSGDWDANLEYGNNGEARVPEASAGLLPLATMIWLGLALVSRRKSKPNP